MENNKNKKSVKFQGDMLNFCDFIQVFVFTPNHHLKGRKPEEDLKMQHIQLLKLTCIEVATVKRNDLILKGMFNVHYVMIVYR